MTNTVRKVKTTAASCSAVLDGTSFTHQKFSLIASTIYFGSYVEQAKEGVGLDVSCCPAHIVQLLFNKVKEKKHWVIPRSVFCVSISYTDRHCYTELEFALTLEWRRRDRSAAPHFLIRSSSAQIWAAPHLTVMQESLSLSQQRLKQNWQRETWSCQHVISHLVMELLEWIEVVRSRAAFQRCFWFCDCHSTQHSHRYKWRY